MFYNIPAFVFWLEIGPLSLTCAMENDFNQFVRINSLRKVKQNNSI
jgi:hypothetical protein